MMIKIIVVFAVTAFLVFFPEIFPRCEYCRKIKPRRLFQFHKSISLKLTYKGNLSLCKKCCKKYNFTSLDRFRKHMRVEKRMEYTVRYNL
ncbi:MAG: hypothetical protein GX166_11400 [Clostridiaceae bacterium]|nr:hypothetical protein [Clostridiaceae bacterium]